MLPELRVGNVHGAGNVAGGELVRSSDIEDQDPRIVLEPIGEGPRVDRLDPGDGPILRPPGRHPAGENAPDPQADRGEQVGRLELIAVGGANDDQVSVGLDRLGDLRREAGVARGGADRAGDVRVVELLVGSRVN